MRSKQNKIKRKISREQKAGRPLSDLEKRVEQAISNLKEVESTLQSILVEIRNPLPDIPNIHAQRVLRDPTYNPLPQPNTSFETHPLETLIHLKSINPELYQNLLNDPETRDKVEKILNKQKPGMTLSQVDTMYD